MVPFNIVYVGQCIAYDVFADVNEPLFAHSKNTRKLTRYFSEHTPISYERKHLRNHPPKDIGVEY